MRFTARAYWIALIAAVAGAGGATQAQATIWDSCLKWLRARPTPVTKTIPQATKTAELELELSSIIQSLLTTTDGTLKPLLGNQPRTGPGAIRFKQLDPEKVLWEQLSPDDQKDLVSTLLRDRDFFENRVIQGLQLRSWIPVPERYTGRSPLIELRDGKRGIDLTKWFGKKIEMRGPRDTTERGWQGIELHLSDPEQKMSAGALLKLVSDFHEIFEIPKRPFHMHIVSDFPLETLARGGGAPNLLERIEQRLRSALGRGDSPVGALRVTEWIARVNTIFEMLSVRYANDPINTRNRMINGKLSYEFDNLRDYHSLFDHILAFARGSQSFPKDEFKIAYVGVRGPGVYIGLHWGMEVRSNHPNFPRDLHAAILNLMEDNFHQENWNISHEEMDAWIAHQKVIFTSSSIPLIHWDQTENLDWSPSQRITQEVIERLELPPHLMPRGGASWFDRNFASGRFRSAQMLFHDWCATPILYQDANLCRRIIEAQTKALAKLLRRYPNQFGELHFDPRPELREFIDESGILERHIESLSW